MNDTVGGLPDLPHFAPKAKRVIYLFQSGGPSQLELFDHKPQLEKLRGQDLPDSVRRGQRLTGMTAYQSSFPDRAFDLQVCSARAIGRDLERVAAAHGEDCRRSLLHQIDAHRADQSRSCHHFFAHRLSTGRTSESGLVDCLRSGQREQGPARFRRHGFARSIERPAAV